MKQKAETIRDGYEDRQTTTEETLSKLEALIKKIVEQKKEQAEKQFDDITYFVYLLLVEKKIRNPETIAKNIKIAFGKYPYWKESENDLLELRKKVLFAVLKGDEKISDDKAISFVENFFAYLFKAFKI